MMSEVSIEMFEALKQTVETLQSDKEQLEDRVSELESEKDDLQNQLDEKDDEIQSLREQLNDEREKRSADVEGCHSRISELKQDIDDVNPTPQGSENTTRGDDLTPIEQLSRADDVSEVTDSPTVERAVSMFKNLDSWGSRTPKGIVLKPADNPLSLLEADQDESLQWVQYYRACEALEQLSQGAVTFFDSDRHGKMLVLHKQSEAFERVVGSHTASLAENKGRS
jgi:TolA-binding protein